MESSSRRMFLFANIDLYETDHIKLIFHYGTHQSTSYISASSDIVKPE